MTIASFGLLVVALARVLGVAQDGGVPHLGCQAEHCEMARKDPSRAEKVASISLTSQGQVFVLDATPDFPLQLKTAPDGILLTHAHIGHYTGLMYLGKESMASRQVPVYATPRMAAFLESNGPWRRLVAGDHISLRVMQPGESISLTSSLRIRPIKVAHREEESDAVGFIATGPRRSLLYIPDIDDWSRWDVSIVELVSQVDVALLDGTFYSAGELKNRSMAEVPHPFITTSMELLEPLVAAGKEIVFIHLNHSNPALKKGSAERTGIKKKGFVVAEEGMEFEL